MKKALRCVLSITMFAVLGISQIPTPAQCQMAYGGLFTSNCGMACCQTPVPFSKQCPSLKASIPHDVITNAVSRLETVLQPVHGLGFLSMPEVRPVARFISSLTATIRLQFCGPPLPARAPPSDVLLINA